MEESLPGKYFSLKENLAIRSLYYYYYYYYYYY